jgi:hypothetical protein
LDAALAQFRSVSGQLVTTRDAHVRESVRQQQNTVYALGHEVRRDLFGAT